MSLLESTWRLHGIIMNGFTESDQDIMLISELSDAIHDLCLLLNESD